MAHRRIKIVNESFEDANPKVEHGTKNICNYCICMLQQSYIL